MKNIDIKNLKTAKRYACALVEAAHNNLDEIESDLQSVDEIVLKNDSFKSFFSHPVVSLKDKKEAIKDAFENKINPITYNFIQTLLDENRFSIFETIYQVFKNEVDVVKNKQRVEVVSAVEFDDNQKQRLQDKLNYKLNKQTIISYEIDENILGGFIVKFDDRVIDLSLRTKFEHLKKQVI